MPQNGTGTIICKADNFNLLKEHPEVFREKAVHLRLDPNIRAGHHKFVKTSGTQSKFGISFEDLQSLSFRHRQHQYLFRHHLR